MTYCDKSVFAPKCDNPNCKACLLGDTITPKQDNQPKCKHPHGYGSYDNYYCDVCGHQIHPSKQEDWAIRLEEDVCMHFHDASGGLTVLDEDYSEFKRILIAFIKTLLAQERQKTIDEMEKIIMKTVDTAFEDFFTIFYQSLKNPEFTTAMESGDMIVCEKILRNRLKSLKD